MLLSTVDDLFLSFAPSSQHLTTEFLSLHRIVLAVTSGGVDIQVFVLYSQNEEK